VTITAQFYPRLLFQLILSHSAWRYTEVTTGENLLALKQTVQNAPCSLSGVPEVVRSHNTSVATHEAKRSNGRELNDNYAPCWTTTVFAPLASIVAKAMKTASPSTPITV